MNYIIYGLLVGMIVGLPIGSAAAMLIQNATKNGIRSGISGGIGNSIAYFIFAGIASLLVSFFNKYILRIEMILTYTVGCIYIFIGVMKIIKRENDYETDNSNQSRFINAMNGLMLGLTNEFALLAIVYLYLLLGIRRMSVLDGLKLATATALGAFVWWIIISIIARIVGKNINIKSIKVYDVFSWIIMVALGGLIIAYHYM